MHKDELKKFRDIFENELQNNILNYWVNNAVDTKSGGFFGAVGIDNKPVLNINKSCVLNARILWTFSAAAKMYPDESYSDLAERAFHVLKNHFLDEQHGGFFMEINSKNQVANDQKHTYVQAFVLYALCKYYQLTEANEVLHFAQDFFLFLDKISKDKQGPGYQESFTRDWLWIDKNRMADNDEPKSMNTHLHLLEAYSALYSIWPDPQVKDRLKELFIIFLDNIIRPSGHLGIFFDNSFEEVEHSKGICSFGHDIEASWLLWEAAQILGDEKICTRMKEISKKMLSAVERVGFDKDGGLFLESYRYGSHVRTNKHWWLQAETLVGFMNGFEITGNQKYWENMKLSWNFINQFVIDQKGGEWFTKVNRLGNPFLIEPTDDPSPYYRNDWKIDPWKAPYHNGRACMEMIIRIDKRIANI
ncbi:MAG: AGE family epimerase/isomerase [Anaerolineaceae bacterium]|nr:AGE family epimerase/isomerase [Anaerolineaceae bacterium]